jgi:molecular chaperone GrpE (heat shock protein)
MTDSLHRRWHEVRSMLTDWLAWLDETQHWVETTAVADLSSEPAEPPVSSDGSASDMASVPASEAMHAPDIAASRSDLSTLFEAMTALRQEVNLQTRSARRDREQASETLEALSTVVDQLSREAAGESASAEVDSVHVDVLLELHDALWRAERQASQVIASTVDTLHDWCERQEIETQPDGVTEASPVEARAPAAAVTPGALGRLRRWFGGSATPTVESPMETHERTDDAPTADDAQVWIEIGAASGRMADRLEGLMTGYRLSLQRLERILSTCGIEPIPCLGQSVDPELMEVVQIVSDSAQPPGMVADTVRCGYRRYGQVYRFAQVVATRSDATPSHTHAEQEHTTDGR